MYSRLILTLVLFSIWINAAAQFGFNVKKTYNETGHEIYFASYNSKGNYIITTGRKDNSIIIWNAEKGTIYRTLTGLKSRQNAVIFSPDNSLLYSGGEDNVITIWDPAASKVIGNLKGHTGPVKALDISPDGRYLASGGVDKTIRIWDTGQNTIAFELKGHNKDVNVLKFSPDGKILASGGADKMLILWNTTNWNIIKSKKVHTDWISDIAFNPDGSVIASCGYDGLIYTSSVPDLNLITTFKGHKDWVQTIDYSPDGKYLLSGGHDQLIILWDAVSGKILSQSEKQNNFVLSVDFCPLRPDFISTTLFSENLETWALAGINYSTSEISSLTASKSVTLDQKNAEVTKSSMIELFSPVPVGENAVSEKDTMRIIGRVNDPEGINILLINKNPVRISEAGIFEYNLNLAKGENPVKIVAINNKGKVNERAFTINCANCVAENLFASVQKPVVPVEQKYYALLIGINDYQSEDLKDLDNPIKDAQSLYDVLVSKYTFDKENITFLKNPTHDEIASSLYGYSKNLTDKDNLLIFYAGHGWWDEKNQLGYWYPADASKNTPVNWFRNSELRDYITSIEAKHILLIADACFSGAIFKTRGVDFSDAPQNIKTLDERASRKAMTSGILEEVPDVSVFIKHLVDRLAENEEKYLASEFLFISFKASVMDNSTSIPQFGTIQNVGDKGGDFIFIHK
jgi:WD40 repeat protein